MADFTQADLDRINKLIAKGAGVASVVFEDQQLTLAPVADQQRARAMIKREVESARTNRLAVTSKGV